MVRKEKDMSNIVNEEEIRKFIEQNKRAHFLQSPEWAKVKTEWENEFIVVRNEDTKRICV